MEESMKKMKLRALFLAAVLSLSSVLSATTFAAEEVSTTETEDLAAAAVPYLFRTEQAEQYENHIVNVWLELNPENSENIASYQLSIQLEDEEGESMTGTTMSLKFDDALETAKVKEAKFNQETQTMDIYVASTQNLVQIDGDIHKLPIGQITVNAAEGEELNQFKIVVSGDTGNLITVGTDHAVKNAKEIYGPDNFTIPSDGTIYGLPVEYPLTIQTANGTVKAYIVTEKTDEEGNVTTEETPAKEKVKKYDTVRLQATPNAGYRLSGIKLTDTLHPGQTVELDGNFTFEMSSVITVEAVFEKIPGIKVTVGEHAKIENKEMDENNSAEFNSREVAKVSAIVPEGKKFSHWVNGEGAIVSYDQTYSFVVLNEIELTPVFVEGDKEVEESVMAVMDPTGTVIEFPAGSGKYRLSYSCKTSVPEGYTVVERGIILTNQIINDSNKDQFVIGGKINGISVAKMKLDSGNGQFIINVNNVKPGQSRVGRTYIIYKDKDGNQDTKYSEDWLSLTTP